MAKDNVEQLELTVNQLIEKHERMRREKESIEKKLQQKESEWHHLKRKLRQYQSSYARNWIEFWATSRAWICGNRKI